VRCEALRGVALRSDAVLAPSQIDEAWLEIRCVKLRSGAQRRVAKRYAALLVPSQIDEAWLEIRCVTLRSVDFQDASLSLLTNGKVS